MATASSTTTPGACPLTIGYWKNHISKWPVQTLTLGSQSYSQFELYFFLQWPAGGDGSLILAKQLIAAKLNVANGATLGGYQTYIPLADTLLANFSGRLPYYARTPNMLRMQMIMVGAVLDRLNNSCE